MWEASHHSGLDRLVDELFMLADQSAKSRTIGVIHFGYPPIVPILLSGGRGGRGSATLIWNRYRTVEKTVRTADVRPKHQSRRRDCLLDNRDLVLSQLEIDNLPSFCFASAISFSTSACVALLSMQAPSFMPSTSLASLAQTITWSLRFSGVMASWWPKT